MTPIELPGSVLVLLVSATVRVLALAGVAALGLTLFRVRATPVRLFTWTAVLYAALVMPLLQWMLPPLPVPMPAFLQSQTEPSVLIQNNESRPTTFASAPVASIDLRSDAPSATATHASSVISDTAPSATSRRNQIMSGIYLSGLCFLLARLVIGLSYGRRLRLASRPITDARVTSRFANHAQSIGLSRIPNAAESEFLSVPVTMGILRPVILFPATWRDWEDDKLNAVIAHEISHVARRDALTQRLSLLHCTFFWFSPLAWWLDQHLADLLEQASDEAALAGGANRTDYARTLLSFFEALQSAPRRVWWQGISMASAGRAEQRVERILAWKGSVAMSLKKSIAVVVILLALPVIYLTASAQPSDRNTDSPGPVAQAVPAKAAQASTAPRAVRAPRKTSTSSSYSYGYDDNLHYVVVSGGEDSITMSGTEIDGEHLQDLKKTIPGDFIWFERDGKSYVIRDQATVSRAHALWAPQSELGKKQEELGKQQEALGKQQEELSAQMEQIRVNVPDMTKELDRLQSKLKELNGGATTDQIADLQSQIGDLQEKIGESQSQAGDQQSKLGEQMGELGRKQGELGEKQGDLGRRQGELAEQAQRKMKSLLDESITKGTAQLEK